jgi:hypothetical protein
LKLLTRVAPASAGWVFPVPTRLFFGRVSSTIVYLSLMAESGSFLKKRTKTFSRFVGAAVGRLGSKGKSFFFLFFKKEALAFLA